MSKTGYFPCPVQEIKPGYVVCRESFGEKTVDRIVPGISDGHEVTKIYYTDGHESWFKPGRLVIVRDGLS